MKKFLFSTAFALLAIVLPFTLTSCGDSDNDDNAPTDAVYTLSYVKTFSSLACGTQIMKANNGCVSIPMVLLMVVR